MRVYKADGFDSSLVNLRRRGGPYQRAAERAIVFADDLQNDPGALAKMPVTNHGENRIKKAVKYDLTGSCRLVTVQEAGFVFLCFVGDHEETDRWLNAKRGLTVRIDAGFKPLVTFETIDMNIPEQRIYRDMGFGDKALLDLLDGELQDALLSGLPRNVARRAEQAKVSISDDDILHLAGEVGDRSQREALLDVLMFLRADDIEQASRRVRVFTGELQPVEEIEPSTKLVDSSDFQFINVDSEHYRQLIEHYAKNADFREWMLFMHPDQKRFVDEDYAGPTKLSGVSGSGKTCVVVRRAIALAAKYPSEKILVLTLNRSLANLIETLVDQAALPDARKQIDVLPFFSLCQSRLAQFEPGNEKLYDDVTWKAKEHIDEVWREFYRCELNNFNARVLQRLHDSLLARGLDAESYVREEFDWIRSARGPDAREEYLAIDRAGRTYGLDESYRKELLQGLAFWEDKMRFVGITDYLGLANALYRHMHMIRPEYRCVLVDESQDFGTVELRIVRRLVAEAENDVFFCGDAAQQVSSKHQNLTEAGMTVPGARSHKLILNYRNSREILSVAHAILVENLTEHMLDAKDFEVLDPKHANFSGPTPMLLQASDLGDELCHALAYARDQAEGNRNLKVCVAVCGYSEHELADFAQKVGLPLLDGTAKIEDSQVFLSDLENTKGFEFQCVVVVNCGDGVIPYPRAPEDEAFRDLSRLYVAMTRAKQQLIVSFSGKPSNFLTGQISHFHQDTWARYFPVSGSNGKPLLPARLEQLRASGAPKEWQMQNGEQYLYTEHAIGCPGLLVEKLRNAVTGRTATSGRETVEWKTIGKAFEDASSNVRSRQVFGPEGFRLLRERFLEEADSQSQGAASKAKGTNDARA